MGTLLFSSVLLLLWSFLPTRYIEVRDSETGVTYFRHDASVGDPVQLSWVHTLEHTPWIERYEVSDRDLKLQEVRIKSFGAGVDPVAPAVTTEDGWVILRKMERSFPALRFIYSKRAGHVLQINGQNLALAERVPHYAALEVEVRQEPRILLSLKRSANRS